MPKKEELRKKELQRLSESLKTNYDDDFSGYIGSQRLFKSEITLKKKLTIIYHNKSNKPFLFEYEGQILPTLQSIRKFPNVLPSITVDAGAVKFMINGADLFRPGMFEWDEFSKGQFLTIVNLQKSAMCIGKALIGSDVLPEKGKITSTLHHLNDELWLLGT